jgi:hypothetical protein
MNIKGTVTKVVGLYPYTVEVGKVTFKSNFQFRVGMKVNLQFQGDVFDFPWPRGFVICAPNGLSEYAMSDEDIKLMKSDSIARHCSRIPSFLHPVVLTGERMEWTKVESFYEYHYSAEYDAKRRVLITNYPIL